jgi:hypothetical protein
MLNTIIPFYIISGPHLIFLNGLLANPGKENDYTLGPVDNGKISIKWWNPDVKREVDRIGDFVVVIVRMDTGERFGVSYKEGIFLNTIKKDT